jgi:hypothetical protein
LAPLPPASYASVMFLAALVVGLLVAYYFGVRPGMIAGGATAALFLLAVVVPPVATYAYLVVCAGVAGVVLLGPKLKRPDALASASGGLGVRALRLAGAVRRAVKEVSGKAGIAGGKDRGKAGRR